jgi:glycosyltransferase involved in cell wall biosynthesis
VPFLPGGVLRLLARRFTVSQCRAVDALVVPTHAMLEVLRRYGVAARAETQGLVLLEAMALGVPVVSTAVLGTTEVLRDAEGAIVVREEESEFAAAVLGLLDDSELQATLRAGGARTAARWSATSLAGRMAELYRDVAGGAAEALGEPVR